jgi:mercuric ion binding protein
LDYNNYYSQLNLKTMKTIKAFLTIVLIIASASFAIALDAKYHSQNLGLTTGYVSFNSNLVPHDAKYRYHDLKSAATTSSAAAGYVSFNSDLVPHDAKYRYHDLGFKAAATTNAEYVSMNSDFVPHDAKYHYNDFAYALTTATIKVYGECAFCKQHIEKAAKIDGVSSARWDENTRLLTVQYNKRFTNPDKIQQSEAAIGHDTEKYIASNIAYNNLPLCCHYRKG